MLPKREGKPRRGLSLLFVAGLVISALLLAACGSSSSDSSSSGSETSGSEGAAGTEEATKEGSSESEGASSESEGAQETTVYAEGVPTLKELYESSNEMPPSSGPPAAKGKEVIWLSCGQQSVGCRGASEGFEEAGEKLGWKVKVIDGKLNVNDGFASAIHTAIASNPDAIVPFGIGCEEEATPFEEAKKAGIAIIESNTPDCSLSGGPDLFTVENAFNKTAKNAAEFYQQFGESEAAYVVDKTEGKAKVILTEWTGTAGQHIGDGWKAVFDKCSECEILENVQWEAAEQGPGGPLEQKFRTALTKYPEANAALIVFDSLATYGGLAKAVVDAGRQDDMLVVSGEGFDETLELIRNNQGLNAEAGAWDQSKWFPWEVADQINRYFAGEEPAPQGVGFAAIDLDHNMPPKGKNYEADVDFAKAYEEVWSGKK